jgi:small acid-soluble spore protein A (major alpha-type SASP)
VTNLFGGTTTQGAGVGGSNNQVLVPQARQALENLKQQTAAELGIQNYAQQYKGDLPSRVNGSVGGYMVKKMIALAEQQLTGGTATPGTTTFPTR